MAVFKKGIHKKNSICAKNKRFITLVLVILQTVIFISTLNSTELFPFPTGLKSHVNFWVKVYSQYSHDQFVIHDNWHLDIIYEVVDWNSNNHAKDGATQWGTVNKVKDKYIWILEEFAKGDCISKQALSPAHAKVFKLWGRTTNPDTYAKAVENIRIQRGLKEEFKAGMERTGRYMKKIRNVFSEYGLPHELTILPQVESCFRTDAYSFVGAAGMWQFTHYTGRLFMEVGYDVDERLDPFKATKAAAKLLKRNYEMLGSWPLALTGYNHGPLGMKAAKEQLGTDDFETIHWNYKSPSFKFASRNFYLEFLAAKHIFENYRLYLGHVNFERPQDYVELELTDNVKLSTLLKEYDVDLHTVAQLNPSLRKPVLRSERYVPAGYKLRLPPEHGKIVQEKYQRIPREEKHASQVVSQYYRVRPGETLGNLAERLHCDTSLLLSINNFTDPDADYEGLIIRIPHIANSSEELPRFAENHSNPIPRSLDARPDEQTNSKPKNRKGKPDEEKLGRSGKSQTTQKTQSSSLVLSQQSEFSFGEEITVTKKSTQKSIQKRNYVIERKESSRNDPGSNVTGKSFQVVQVDLAKPISGWTTAYPEETLGHYAAWLKVPIQDLRRVNRIDFGTDMRPGQKVRLLYNNVSSDEFHQLRLEYHKGIQEDFFEHFRVIDTEVHKVKSDETIWQLCMYEYNVPYWLVERYNSGKNLIQLDPGSQVIIPVIIEKGKR